MKLLKNYNTLKEKQENCFSFILLSLFLISSIIILFAAFLIIVKLIIYLYCTIYKECCIIRAIIFKKEGKNEKHIK